jgi:hypothetical protein
MVSVDSTSVRRRGLVAIAAAVVFTALALTNAVPARAAAWPAASKTGASARDDMTASRQGKNGVGLRTHGFIRDANGVLTTIDVPGATLTQIAGINDRGVMVGFYADAGGRLHGFFRDPSGAFTTLDAPGASLTLALGINNQGDIVGAQSDGSRIRGFVLSNGTFTAIAAPATVIESFPFDIDDRGRIVGFYF